MVNNEIHQCMRDNGRYSSNSARTGTFPYQSPAGIMMNPYQHHHLSHQYSSSQAQLQSLTSPDLTGTNISTTGATTMSNCDTLRKTPNIVRKALSHTQRTYPTLQQPQPQQQQQQQRAQASLTAGTKPMTSSMMLNEPSFLATMSRHNNHNHHHHHHHHHHNHNNGQQNSSSNNQNHHNHQLQLQPQHRSMSHPVALSTPAPGGAQNHLPLPPPYSVVEQSSSLTPSANIQMQQNVICHQTPSQTALFSHETNNVSQQCAASNPTTSSRTAVLSSSTGAAATATSSSAPSSSPQTTPTTVQPSATAITQQVQSSNQPMLPLFQASSSSHLNHHLNQHHHHAPHPQQILNLLSNGHLQQQTFATPNNNLTAPAQFAHSINNIQQQQLPNYLNHSNELNFINHFGASHHMNHHLNNSSKSKSCLTCADISIKWYIVVIALLGLICALIGTIVGAVHSAGRDYISLALLLIGVGLVLVAISWIALRITIKTYRTSSSSLRARANQPSSSSAAATTAASAPLVAAPQPAGNHHRRHLRAQPIPPPQLGAAPHALARLFGPSSSSPSSSLHRSLINERLYMMAAAAAAASAISRQSAAAAAAATSSAANNQPGSASNLQQQETTRSASRLSSTSTSTSDDDNEAATAASAAAASNLPNNNGSNNNTGILYNIKQRLPRRLARLISYTNLQEQSNQLQAAASSRRRQTAQTTTQPFDGPTIPPPALAALLHHYSALLPPGHPANFLFPPPAHLGAPGFSFSTPGDTFNLRPPPPSYNASMQDTRLRMLMQERAHLNNIMLPTNNQQPSSPPPPPRPRPPPPPPPPPSELTTTEADDSNSSLDLTTRSDRLSEQEQRQQVTNATLEHQIRPSGSNQSSNLETSLAHPSLVPSTSQSNGRVDIMKYEQQKQQKQQNQHKEQPRTSRNNKTSVPTTRLKPSPSVPTLVNNDIYVSSSSSPNLAARDQDRARDVYEERQQAGASTTQTSTSSANNWIRNSTVVSIGSGADNGSSFSTNTSEERHVNKSVNKNENESENKNEIGIENENENENKNRNENGFSMNEENQRHEVKILGYL